MHICALAVRALTRLTHSDHADQVDPIYADEAAEWIKTKGAALGQQPFFLAVNFINPHDVMFFLASKAQRKSKEDWSKKFPSPFPAESFVAAPEDEICTSLAQHRPASCLVRYPAPHVKTMR